MHFFSIMTSANLTKNTIGSTAFLWIAVAPLGIAQQPSTQTPRSLSRTKLTQCGSDQGQLVPLVEAIENNLGRKPEQVSADAGYCSEPSLKALVARGIDGYVAPGRAQHPTAANGKVGGPLTQLMRKDRRRRLRNALPIEKASGGTGVRTDQTRHAASASSCCAASRKYVPSGP